MPTVWCFGFMKKDGSLQPINALKIRKENNGLVFAKQRNYSVIGSIHKDALFSKYNAVVLKLENKLSNEEILTHKKRYIRSKYKVSEDKDFYKIYSRVVYGLLDSNGKSLGTKQLLMNFSTDTFMKSEINRERKWSKPFRKSIIVSKFDTFHSKLTEIIQIYEKVVSKILQSKIRYSTSQC
jgi:hypothetical protein